MTPSLIDVGFDTRSDSDGQDPDRYSATLRRYHQILWSRPLPNGVVFELSDTIPDAYLHHSSTVGEHYLSSDSIVHTYSYWESMHPIVSELDPAEMEQFETLACTIGGYIVFPGNKIDGMMTINGARGFSRTIADRFDLTLECIRRHYRGEPSPLDSVLARYRTFFDLFVDFHGYVDFFLLQDLVDERTGTVRFLMPFDDFRPPAVPHDVDSYRSYRDAAMCFTTNRNARIAQLGL
ncbi:MAG: hypothetical protein GC157_09960 [Frankiales bacterium]|nr:hypothetical protein [Frankiales bacterium]